MTKQMKTTEILTSLQSAVEAIVEGLNLIEITVEGARVMRDEPRPAIGAKILADKLAGAVHEQLNGRITIERDPNGAPRFSADGKVITRATDGQNKYLLDAFEKMDKAYASDPECARDWTVRTADIYNEQQAFTDALVALKRVFVDLYIEACAGTETTWTPYVERQIAEMQTRGSQPQLEATPEADARKAAVKAQIAAARKRHAA